MSHSRAKKSQVSIFFDCIGFFLRSSVWLFPIISISARYFVLAMAFLALGNEIVAASHGENKRERPLSCHQSFKSAFDQLRYLAFGMDVLD